MLIAGALRVMTYTGMIEDENKIWDNICNEGWLTNTFVNVKSERVMNSIIISLMETILQKQDRWAWQLPHLFSIICRKNIEKEELKKVMFACVVISSLYSDTFSALRRTILNNKIKFETLQKEWSSNLQEIYYVAPEGIKSRLRPAILCLNYN